MSLSSLFAQIEAGLKNAEEDAPLPTFPTRKNPQWEEEAIEKNGVSHISHTSHSRNSDTIIEHKNNPQARVGVRAEARTRPPMFGVGNVGNVGNTNRVNTFPFPLSQSQVGNVGNKGAALLPAPAPGLSADEAAAFDERAAILEFDCGLSRGEAERQALAELRPQPVKPSLPEQDGIALWRAGVELLPPERAPCPGYRGEEWSRTLTRARSFLDSYGVQAEALGWTAARLFGAHPEAGIVRVDTCGALVLPIGGPVLAITATEMRFAHLTHRQKPGQPEGIPLWELAR